jgi:hypothetical protein
MTSSRRLAQFLRQPALHDASSEIPRSAMQVAIRRRHAWAAGLRWLWLNFPLAIDSLTIHIPSK